MRAQGPHLMTLVWPSKRALQGGGLGNQLKKVTNLLTILMKRSRYIEVRLTFCCMAHEFVCLALICVLRHLMLQ